MLGETHPHGAQSAQAEKHIVGPTQSPISNTVSLRCCQVEVLAATAPNITSEWPPIYLVPDWIERSTPFSSALK